MDRMLGQSRDLQPVLLGGRLLGNSCARKVLSVVSGVRRLGADGERDDADRRRIADTTTCTKPPYFGRTIALWGLYSAFISFQAVQDMSVVSGVRRPSSVEAGAEA